MTSAEVEAARQGWEDLGDVAVTGTGSISNFHSYPPENKAEKGRAAVKGTLEKRTVQADFLVYFGQRKINAHANVKGWN